ncbi:MAG: site-2 protease family protein, partial [candidate division NC10 bacterium]|nr:site-2 protease family protein [candidate division NC10 bacterium]
MPWAPTGPPSASLSSASWRRRPCCTGPVRTCRRRRRPGVRPPRGRRRDRPGGRPALAPRTRRTPLGRLSRGGAAGPGIGHPLPGDADGLAGDRDPGPERPPRAPRLPPIRVLNGRLAPLGYHPLLRSREEIVLLRAAPRRRPWLREPWPNLVLFVATMLTTLFVGALHQGVDPLQNPRNLLAGLPFAATLLAILGVHELGHYFTAKAYGIRVTLPYFIPAPIGLGTFGAFIKMKSPVTDRRALLDVGIAGPLAGLVLAIPAVLVGLRLSTIVPAEGAGVGLGTSLLFLFLQGIAVGPVPDGLDILLHPVAFAGWIG